MTQWKMAPDKFLKNDGHEHEFSSTQINLPEPLRSSVLSLAARIPDEDLAEDGRETEPHVTVKYGLHEPSPEGVRQTLSGEAAPEVKLGKTSIFPNKDNQGFEVVKIDVDSPDLHWLNQQINENHKHTDTFPGYHPHVTLAYVKPGAGKKYEGMADLMGQSFRGSSVTFSDRDGQKHQIPLGAVPGSSNAPDEPQPEAPQSLAIQIQQLQEGKRKAVILTPGEEAQKPEGFQQLRTPRGTFYYDHKKINARAIRRAIEFDRLGEILGDTNLGYGAPDKPNLRGPVYSVVASQGGVDTQAVATDTEHLPETMEAAEKVGDSVRVEEPQATLAKRAQDRLTPPSRIPSGSGSGGVRRNESFFQYKNRYLSELLQVMADWLEDPSQKVVLDTHPQGAKIARGWIENGMPHDYSTLKASSGRSEAAPEGVDRIIFQNGTWEIGPVGKGGPGIYLRRNI